MSLEYKCTVLQVHQHHQFIIIGKSDRLDGKYFFLGGGEEVLHSINDVNMSSEVT